MGDKSFIEVQFPVSKISKESYKERKSASSQTLTGLGKWWGRKPLVLVRATILGALMPASNNPEKDMEVFLKILTMDREGLALRRDKSISINSIYENLTEVEKSKYFDKSSTNKISYKSGIKKSEKENIQDIVFSRLPYDMKLAYCCRPEQVCIKDKKEWDIINNHLGTNAENISELIEELGIKRFGHKPVIGDCFAGGGSIPFEAAKIGARVHSSDLNPIATLLNWANLNLLNKNEKIINDIKVFQDKVYDNVVERFNEWGIETNEKGWKAKCYIYCNEARCPECGAIVPLAPSWIISKKYKTIAILNYNEKKNNFDITIKSDVTKEEMEYAKNEATIKNSRLICPKCKLDTPITSLRKDRKVEHDESQCGLRLWEKGDIVNKEEDIFKERLYCIKYIEKYEDKNWIDVMKKPAPVTDATVGAIHYCSPNEFDLLREEKVKNLIEERFNIWQQKGYIPSNKIEEGEKTNELIRTRGWKYWSNLFNPRQLLTLGLFMENIDYLIEDNKHFGVIGLLGINKLVDFNSKLSNWASSVDIGVNTFYNQAFNTLFNYSTRACSTLYTVWMFNISVNTFVSENVIEVGDARNINNKCDIWITDPPYADAVNYHELSELFLAWDYKLIKKIFPNWYSDSKRILAIKGKGASFNESMIEVYSNLEKNMPYNGMQVVMFTHQDVKVWAELALILWASRLQVTAAWNIATETESGGLKEGGNYVKGTVILVLRKQNSDDIAYLDELYPEIEDEVKLQIDTMRDLDDKEEPNFTDADYLLAAYAASLKVLTSYKNIEDIDVQYELSKSDGESPIVNIINDAVKIAFDYLTPNGFDSYTWKTLLPEERFYIKGLDTEKNNVYKVSAYQELGRGFGVSEYSDMMASSKANKARLKTASEFAMKYTNDNTKFGHSILRNVLVALYKSTKEEDATKGKAWLRNEVDDYWNERSKIIEILDYLSTLEHIENMKHWEKDAKSARILVELVRNDGV